MLTRSVLAPSSPSASSSGGILHDSPRLLAPIAGGSAPLPLHDPTVLVATFDAQERSSTARLAESKRVLDEQSALVDKALTQLNALRAKGNGVQKSTMDLMTKIDKTLASKLPSLVMSKAIMSERKTELEAGAASLAESAGELSHAFAAHDQVIATLTGQTLGRVVEAKRALATCTSLTCELSALEQQRTQSLAHQSDLERALAHSVEEEARLQARIKELAAANEAQDRECELLERDVAVTRTSEQASTQVGREAAQHRTQHEQTHIVLLAKLATLQVAPAPCAPEATPEELAAAQSEREATQALSRLTAAELALRQAHDAPVAINAAEEAQEDARFRLDVERATQPLRGQIEQLQRELEQIEGQLAKLERISPGQSSSSSASISC